MADDLTPPVVPAAAPAAAPVSIPAGGGAPDAPATPPTSVPVSALDLGFDTKDELKRLAPSAPSGPGVTNLPEKTAPTGPAAGATGPAPTGTAAPAPTGPAPSSKIKINGKEYTVEELEKELAARKAAQATAAAPTGPAVPAAVAPLTPEQIAAQKTELKKQESAWCEQMAKDAELSFITTPDEVETILTGGKDAVAMLDKKMKEVCSQAVLLARKSMYHELNPKLEQLAASVTPLVTNNLQLERIAVEQQFLAAYPEYGPHAEITRNMAEAIVAAFPKEVEQMTREQFCAEVAAQADREIQAQFLRWNPGSTKSWKEAAKEGAAAPAPAAPAPAPAAPAPAPVKVLPPHGNSPAAAPTAGAPNWNKDTAKSLRD